MRFDEVLNQSPPYVDVNLYASDLPLQSAVAAEGGTGEAAALSAFGKRWGTAGMLDLARQANEDPPKLQAYDANGFRRDFVEFHPAYHHFMAESTAAGLHGSTWSDDATPAPAPAQVTRAARFYMAAQVETGHLCPITMTRAAVAALAVEPALATKLSAKIMSRRYDPPFPAVVGEGRHHARHGHDRAARRHRRSHQHDARRARGRRLFRHRPKMVHVGAHVRRFSGAGAGEGRIDLFSDAAFSARRVGEWTAFPALEEQARQSLERLLGGRVRGCIRLARGRGGQGRTHHHQHGAAHAARLRHRIGRHHAHGVGAGDPPHAPPQRVPEAARRISR